MPTHKQTTDCTNTVEKIKNSVGLIFVLTEVSPGQGLTIKSKGSGFVFHNNDVMVTCNHVITGTDPIIRVRFPDTSQGELINATVLIRDEEHDLALLKLSNTNRTPLIEADRTKIKEGMPVLFSGYPLSLVNLTTHQGVLSAIVSDASGVTTYLIDGTVNSGNSGCPLMTIEGEVIGVVNAKRREQNDVLSKVERMSTGAVGIYNTDLIEILNALINNVQLGIGYAVPVSYIPRHQG
jgi:S1-C subfamily serine protease